MGEKQEIGVGIIGMGNRGTGLARSMAPSAKQTGLRVVAMQDDNPARAKESKEAIEKLFSERGVELDITVQDSHAALINDPRVDVVMVTGPQCMHRQAAVPALESGKKTFSEKPLAHTLEDAIAIVEAEAKSPGPMMVGFTRRYEASYRKAFELLEDGAIGELHMMKMRGVISNCNYFHKFYRKREWSGDVLNEKCGHHFDVFNWFARARAARVSGFGGQRVFKPDPTKPARCIECDIECPYRVPGVQPSREGESEQYYRNDTCVWAPGADINDHATINVQYENGVLATLFFCIFGPRWKDEETFELVGTKGRIILDRHAGSVHVVTDYGDTEETINVCKRWGGEFGHFGADDRNVKDMSEWARGAKPIVSAMAGYEAIRIAMAAIRSVDNNGELIDLSQTPEPQV